MLRSYMAQPRTRTMPSASDSADRRMWGEIPAGFTKLVEAGGGRLVVRQDRVGGIDLATCRQAGERDGPSPFQGRQRLRTVRLPGGESMLIRPYHHGGILRALTRDVFATWPPRPFRELAVTEELRRRGIPTVEVYAACIERLRGPFYRGWLVTRQLERAEDLWAAVQSGAAQTIGMERVLDAVAKSVRALHRAGVYHNDLNLKNILIRDERGGARGYIIDFDKAKFFLGALPPPLARRNLARLLRSIRKLDPQRVYFSSAIWDQFLEFYNAAE